MSVPPLVLSVPSASPWWRPCLQFVAGGLFTDLKPALHPALDVPTLDRADRSARSGCLEQAIHGLPGLAPIGCPVLQVGAVNQCLLGRAGHQLSVEHRVAGLDALVPEPDVEVIRPLR